MSIKYKVVVTEQAKQDLCSLENVIVGRITKKLRYFESVVNPLSYAEPLKTPFQGQYRFRVGEYRIFFKVEPSGIITILLILNIKHRKDCYR